MADSGVPPVGIVPSLDELEDGLACFGLGAEPLPVEEFALEGGLQVLFENPRRFTDGLEHGLPFKFPQRA